MPSEWGFTTLPAMSNQEKIYCFDSSIFISLNRIQNYVPIPNVWQELEKLFNAGKIISHEFVYEEFNPERKNPDFIAKWIKDKKGYFLGITDKQSKKVEEILQKFPDFIDAEKENDQADPWIIALAIEKMEEVTLFGQNTLVYVVSQEKISSSKRIPAVCREFKVPHMNLDDFLKDNGWHFGIIKP